MNKPTQITSYSVLCIALMLAEGAFALLVHNAKPEITNDSFARTAVMTSSIAGMICTFLSLLVRNKLSVYFISACVGFVLSGVLKSVLMALDSSVIKIPDWVIATLCFAIFSIVTGGVAVFYISRFQLNGKQ